MENDTLNRLNEVLGALELISDSLHREYVSSLIWKKRRIQLGLSGTESTYVDEFNKCMLENGFNEFIV